MFNQGWLWAQWLVSRGQHFRNCSPRFPSLFLCRYPLDTRPLWVVNQNRPLPSGKLKCTMVATVLLPFDAGGGRVAEESKLPGQGRQARGGRHHRAPQSEAWPTVAVRLCRRQTSGSALKAEPRKRRACVIQGFSFCCLPGWSPWEGRARVRISTAHHPRLCVSCLTIVSEVRALSVSSAPKACPDVWVSRPAWPGPVQLGLCLPL